MILVARLACLFILLVSSLLRLAWIDTRIVKDTFAQNRVKMEENVTSLVVLR